MSFWSRIWHTPHEAAHDRPQPPAENLALALPVVDDTSRQSSPAEGWNSPSRQHRAAVLEQGIHRRRRLDYPEAAASFLEWLQAQDETGEITRPRLDALYAEHCEIEGLAMVPLNFLFQALSRHAAKWERRVPRRDGRRQRVTTYDIPRKSSAVPANYRSEAQLNRRAA